MGAWGPASCRAAASTSRATCSKSAFVRISARPLTRPPSSTSTHLVVPEPMSTPAMKPRRGASDVSRSSNGAGSDMMLDLLRCGRLGALEGEEGGAEGAHEVPLGAHVDGPPEHGLEARDHGDVARDAAREGDLVLD